MRTAVQLAGMVLVLGGLTTACGGDDDKASDGGSGSSSDGVSTKEFCTQFNSLYTSVLQKVNQSDPKETIKATKAWADDLEDLGAPKGMSGEEKKGYQVFVDTIQDVDDDASVTDLQQLGENLPKDDQKAGETFGDWTKENCPLDTTSGSESDEPSSSPSSS